MRGAIPSVTWKGVKLSRLVLGHNPLKGTSHSTPELSAEMDRWHAEQKNGLALLTRCEACGINTVQFGGERPHALLTQHKQAGGALQWIATIYGNSDGDLGVGDKTPFNEELRGIRKVDARLVGIQHFGESTDRLVMSGKMGVLKDRMKTLRDTGLMIGVCSHLPEVLEQVAAADIDVDFYQTCFYTVYSAAHWPIDRSHEVFDDADRDRMVSFIRCTSKPCAAFKILGASRKCGTPAEVREAFRFAFDNIKRCDVVCVGMWQKNKDQVAEDAEIVADLLA